MDRHFWVGVVSRDHVQLGVEGRFAQLNHGKRTPLQGLRPGDGLVFYSPKTSHPDGEACQMFTAISIVATGEIYQVDATEGFKPFRVDARYLDSTEVPIKPLLSDLSFIRDKVHWGVAFRFGSFHIPSRDFKIIAEAMGRDFERDFGT